MGKPTKAELEHKIQSLENEIAALKAAQPEVKPHKDPSLYTKLIHNIAAGILLIDAQGKIVDANRHALKVLGYTLDEISSMDESDLVHPDNLNAQPVITAEEMRESDQEVTLERHYLCNNGRYIPVAVHVRSFQGDMLIVTFQDISKAKASQKDLRKANEALEIVYRCANAAIISLDADTCVRFWNPAAEKMFGWTQSEVVGKPYPAVPKEMLEGHRNFFLEKIVNGRCFTDVEVLRQRKDGSRFYVSATTGPTRNGKGKINGLISIMIDITHRKEAELALQQSEERYRSLVENTQDGYFVCDQPTGKFRFLNQRMCDLLRYTSDEAMNLTLWDIISPEDHDTIQAMIKRQQDASSVNSTARACHAVDKSGIDFRVEISVCPVTFEQRPAIQGFLRDVTEKERLHAKLQQAQRLESIGTLAGGVAHDFNNLLMAIQGNASLALTKLFPHHPAYERLRNITTYVHDASSLTKQLLGFARGGKYEVKPTDLNTLVEKTAKMFGRTKKEITIRIQPQIDIWAAKVDRGQIEQVLLNLLVNAWQAMPEGGQITIKTDNVVLDPAYARAYNIKPGQYIKTSVADNGIGIDKSTQNKIFEPFFTTKDRARGTGLGLASAYGIVKNHGGNISVYSELGIGTTFTFHLPVSQQNPPAPTVSDQKVLTGAETVLIVDDEKMVIDVAQEMLKAVGYCTVTASSGEEALDIYRKEQEKIDIVLLDMIMPGLSGEGTFGRLKEINPDVVVLLSSGYSLDGNASRILDCGCNGFIQKPYNIEELSTKIREVLDNPAGCRKM
ncbi:MAG: PAS domain S-box protein [Desulfobacteraceae bacterium]